VRYVNLWTDSEISEILRQLDMRRLPFENVTLEKKDGGFLRLGRGGFAEVYGARARGDEDASYAVKVIGFGESHPDSGSFREAADAQYGAGLMDEHIVKVIDYSELWLTMGADDQMIDVCYSEPETKAENQLKLQFILMEKLLPVFERGRGGEIRTNPGSLREGDEGEVLKLANDICLALETLHNDNILHRDVKLENIFYDEENKIYELGDFGIARQTGDGFAGTVAYTNGYAAPEVRSLPDYDGYDCTADIYSLGMVLYLLMNNFRFPGEESMYISSGCQYKEGYYLPRPASASEKFGAVICRMCSFDPDLRQQSVFEVRDDISRLVYSDTVGKRRRNKEYYLMTGFMALFTGIVTWFWTGPRWIGAAAFIVAFLWIYLYICLSFTKGKGILRIICYRLPNWMAVVLFALLCVRGAVESGIAGLVFCMIWHLWERSWN
jgi:hypothetical protein